ncbi:MAG TPA: ABC transporter substrate-binding protein [Acidimicrobiia bacterium]|jgi:peptide/nickel transport system substrate-binding protein
MYRFRGITGLVVALLLVVAACGDSDEGTDTTAAPGGGQTTETTSPDEGPARGEVLRVALPNFAEENLNPLIMDGVTSLDLSVLIFDPIVMIDVDGGSLPGVADSWDIDEDGLGVTLHIREGIEFHNGDPLTAEDVVFTLKSWMDEELVQTATNPRWPNLVESPDDIELVDEYTVHVTTVFAADALIPFFSPLEVSANLVLPKNYIEEVGWNEFNENPIGSGPWQFQSYAPGDEFTFTALDSHPFRPVPGFDELQVLLIPEAATREAMLRNDEIDIAAISIETANDIDALEDVTVEERFGGQITLMNMGTWFSEDEVGALANVQVREALSLAIDRQEVVDTLFDGRAVAVPGSLPATILPGVQGIEYEDWDLDQTLYDPDRARELLAEAGYADGFTLRVFAQPLSGVSGDLLAEVFAAYWDEIGVTTEIIPIDLATMEEMSARPPLAEDIYGAMKIHRRPPAFSDETTLGKYHWDQANGEAMLGPEGEGHVPDIHERQSALRALSGDARVAYAQELGELISSLYVSPTVLNYNAVWGIGNNVGSWSPNAVLSQVGMSLETAQPAS